MGTNRRRQILVNRPLQSRIILNVSWPSAVALTVTALLLGVFCKKLSDEALAAQVELPSLVPIFIIVACFLVVASAYLVFNALKFSHRIAGPMYRVRRTIEAVEAGDLSSRIILRRGDFLTEVADPLNDFLEWLEEHPPTVGEAAESVATPEAEPAAIGVGAASDGDSAPA